MFTSDVQIPKFLMHILSASAILHLRSHVMSKYQQTTAMTEGNNSPATTPRNSTASSKPSIWAKFDSASTVTPADVIVRPSDSCATGVRSVCGTAADKPRVGEQNISRVIFSSVAQIMLCMPATSVVSEGVFFKSRRHHHVQKNTLVPSKTDTVIFLIDNL